MNSRGMPGAARIAATLAVALALGHSADGPSEVSARGSNRLTVFISDLHLGVGRQTPTVWHSMEDFRWEGEFRAFLDEIDRLGRGQTDLILLGDTFELWQSLKDNDCLFSNLNFGCDERGALARVTRVIENHRSELEALGRFADRGANAVVLVPGNHDAALLFGAVERAVLEATGSGSRRVTVARSGSWLSTDGQVFADHGHQMGKEVNRFDNWPRPFVGPNHRYLQRTWGEQFVQRYYNPFEAKYPIIDNILENGVGAVYAMKAEGAAGSTRAIGRFLSFFLSKLSRAQFEASLGEEGEPPQWDLKAVRGRGNAFIIESFPPGPLREGAKEAAKRGDLGASMASLTTQELTAICDYREALQRREENAFTLVEAPEPCPKKELGAAGQALLRRSKHAVVSQYLEEVHAKLSRARRGQPRFALYVYGHTHAAESSFDPMENTSSEWHPTVLNTGAWQRVIAPRELDQLKCGRSEAQMLALQPDVLPACYSAVLIAPYADAPAPELRFWATDGVGDSGLRESCPPLPPCK